MSHNDESIYVDPGELAASDRPLLTRYDDIVVRARWVMEEGEH